MTQFNYMLLFTRRRQRLCIGGTIFMAIIFVVYQFIIYYLVSKTPAEHIARQLGGRIRGTHAAERAFYTPKDGKFTCIKSGEVIEFDKVNDDYCDCADSSDEPGTNACSDGTFYCSQESKNKKFPRSISSSKVNDGICDCCDGSDEFSNKRLLIEMERNLQKHMNRFLIPCPNQC